MLTTVQSLSRQRQPLTIENRTDSESSLNLTPQSNVLPPQTARLGRSAQSQKKATRSTLPGDGISRQEAKLARMVNRYRVQNGLPRIPLSKALSTVANRHVRDLTRHGFTVSLHGWSDAPYDGNNPATYPSMWEAPQRLRTGYPGNGYENAYWNSGGAKAANSFNAWKNSPPHNDLMLNLKGWQRLNWRSLGVGIQGNYAVLWVGEQADPTGKPGKE
ncbi:MAG: CAP domain-containing protein [Oculatellaceae cyanobacterium Prado106]|jgi:uncharacterized protein YkwD|nr:CAP domain-containing protein [Oculatellaceae cyanobacterium Prado106]